MYRASAKQKQKQKKSSGGLVEAMCVYRLVFPLLTLRAEKRGAAANSLQVIFKGFKRLGFQ